VPLPLRGVRRQRRLGAGGHPRAQPAVLVAALGLGAQGLVVAKTIRRRFITLPGRLTHTARRRHLHLPSGWPWAEGFLTALFRLRALPLRT
jgi:hypothetical protein